MITPTKPGFDNLLVLMETSTDTVEIDFFSKTHTLDYGADGVGFDAIGFIDTCEIV